jgi:metal-responsive CopG/Arc/MetJ family transcriptional regulator
MGKLKKQVNFFLEENLIGKLDELSHYEGRTRSNMIRNIVKSYLETK